MRMSCNGCRVLRKGCSERCSIKPCLQWMKTPQAQANATVFLAKFYGRAGLLNLINAGPHHLRPAIFRSLLYEACGRIVNPVHGSAGLLCSENWQLCQAAVEAVLRGAPIEQVATDSSTMMSPPLKACNIRHVAKDERSAASARDLLKVKARGRFKRARAEPKSKLRAGSLEVNDAARVMWSWSHKEEVVRSSSHESGVSQDVEPPSQGEIGTDGESAFVEAMEESLAKSDEPADDSDVDLQLTLGFEPADESDVDLDLTLGFEPFLKQRKMGPIKIIEKTRGCPVQNGI